MTVWPGELPLSINVSLEVQRLRNYFLCSTQIENEVYHAQNVKVHANNLMHFLFITTDCITNTCPCNIQRFFSSVKIENFFRFFWIFFLFLLKT